MTDEICKKRSIIAGLPSFYDCTLFLSSSLIIDFLHVCLQAIVAKCFSLFIGLLKKFLQKCRKVYITYFRQGSSWWPCRRRLPYKTKSVGGRLWEERNSSPTRLGATAGGRAAGGRSVGGRDFGPGRVLVGVYWWEEKRSAGGQRILSDAARPG